MESEFHLLETPERPKEMKCVGGRNDATNIFLLLGCFQALKNKRERV